MTGFFFFFFFFWHGECSMKYSSFVTNFHHQNISANKEANFSVAFLEDIGMANHGCVQGLGSDINGESGMRPFKGVRT